jgi:hypothetical protein
VGVFSKALRYLRLSRRSGSVAERRPPTTNASKIADLPSFKSMEVYATFANAYSFAVRSAAPMADLLGIDIAEHRARANDVTKLAAKLASHRALADRFNSLYANRGWIAYGSMNHQALLDAIDAGEAGDCERGEAILVNAYTEQFLSYALMLMSSLNHFRDRSPLAALAKEDYFAGRYHACVPVVLMLIDGLATDVAESNESFFSERADLTAWDSVEGHPTALPALKNVMCTPRQKRRTESLRVPHRHGILHGRDLGFANQLVAAKCWGTLFALGEWARKVEDGKRREPTPEPRKSLREHFRSFADHVNHQQRWREWTATPLCVGVDFPVSGSADQYQPGRPERLLAEFLTAWLRQNYGAMGMLCSFGSEALADSTKAGRVGKLYRTIRLTNFSILTAAERAPTFVAFEVELEVNGSKSKVELHAVRQNSKGEWLYADVGEGAWRLMNWELVSRKCGAQEHDRPGLGGDPNSE